MIYLSKVKGSVQPIIYGLEIFLKLKRFLHEYKDYLYGYMVAKKKKSS